MFCFVCHTQYMGGNECNTESVLWFLFWLLYIILPCSKIYSSLLSFNQEWEALLTKCSLTDSPRSRYTCCPGGNTTLAGGHSPLRDDFNILHISVFIHENVCLPKVHWISPQILDANCKYHCCYWIKIMLIKEIQVWEGRYDFYKN